MTVLPIEIRRTITPDDIDAYATAKSKRIMIRTNDGDTWRKTTKKEAATLRTIIKGALYSIRGGGDIKTTADTAELISQDLLPYDTHHSFWDREFSTNCYYSVYIPIQEWARQWKNHRIDT